MTPLPMAQAGVGVVVPHDMALDRELWRWAPDDVSLHFTRTASVPLPVTIESVTAISEVERIVAAVRDLATTRSGVCAYACTSGSFVRGVAGERELTAAMRSAGTPGAVTTSGALLDALEHLGVKRLAVATPYHVSLTRPLEDFLAEAGIGLAGSAHLGLTSEIWTVPYDTTADLVRRADRPEAEAVFVSCTNLATYDLIADLEAELGKPVVTANQVTMWAALRAIGRSAVGPGQRLLQP